MFLLMGLAVVIGMAAVLWWALKYGRTPFWFFGFANARNNRPILYWFQIASYAAVMSLIAYIVGTITFGGLSN